MNDDEILTILRDTCARILKVAPGEVVPEAGFREDLGADSLDLVELHATLEDLWGPIPRETFAQIRTVGDVLEQARQLVSR
ncbi:acyl carrier protein [Herbidospora sp. RD11066]